MSITLIVFSTFYKSVPQDLEVAFFLDAAFGHDAQALAHGLDRSYQFVEIAGARVLTPFYGSSIYVWSSTITVTLASLSIGYFVGGFLADRHPRATWFYGLIFLGGEYIGAYARVSDGSTWHTTTREGGKYAPYEPPQDDYFEYEQPLDFVSRAERRKLLKETNSRPAKRSR